MRNRAWWVGAAATPARRRLHDRFIAETRAGTAEVQQGRQAIVLAGPPGAGKTTVLDGLLGERRTSFLVVDADEFKRQLLREALADGSYERWLMPAEVRALQQQGERFFPLELAALVHEESARLAQALRSDAIAVGDDLVIDTVLGKHADALALGRQLDAVGYRVHVIDVEVPYEVSEARIRARWIQAYEAALAGGDPLGGRWVPSDYARTVFDGPGGRSRPEAAARALAEQCPAVTRYQVFRSTADAPPLLEVDSARHTTGAALVDVEHAAVQARLAASSAPPIRGRGDRSR